MTFRSLRQFFRSLNIMEIMASPCG
jgi:hypothetical protein